MSVAGGAVAALVSYGGRLFLVDGCDRGCGAPFFFILWQAFGLRDCAVHRLFLVVDSGGAVVDPGTNRKTTRKYVDCRDKLRA